MCECSIDAGKLSELIKTTKWWKGLHCFYLLILFYRFDSSMCVRSKFHAVTIELRTIFFGFGYDSNIKIV